MRLPASRFFVALFAISFGGTGAHAGSELECDDPPGGKIVCEGRQTPSCETKAGKLIKGECLSTPQKAEADFATWLLTGVCGMKAPDPKDSKNREILKSGRCTKGESTITFSPFEFKDVKFLEKHRSRPD